MSKEYIERGALLEILENQGHADIDDVLNIPAADVVEVKHGEWVNMVRAVIDTVGDCSECGKEAVWRTLNKPYALCPHCGAKMDGGADNG